MKGMGRGLPGQRIRLSRRLVMELRLLGQGNGMNLSLVCLVEMRMRLDVLRRAWLCRMAFPRRCTAQRFCLSFPQGIFVRLSMAARDWG